MRILVVSSSSWDENNSFGNTFSNILGGNFNYDIAHVYCRSSRPNTTVATKFFHITERSIIKSIFKGTSSGCEVYQTNNDDSYKLEGIRKHATILRWQVFFWGRDLVWSTNGWKSNELDKFILDFNPDIIFQPVFYSSYINKIAVYAKRLTGKPMVGFIADDNYTLKQFSLSPLYWIDRLIKRRFVKRTIDASEVLYTITDTQKDEYNQIFGEKCKVLYKGGDFSNFDHKKERLNDTLQFVYTGNLGCGRWKSLALIGDAIAKTGKKAELVIYSQTPLSNSQIKRMTSSGMVKFMGGVHFSKIKGIQRNADVLIHVESFDLKERYKSRLSFSTKIVDYFEAGRCVLAVGWDQTGAIEYLIKNDAAMVITAENDIETKVTELVNNPQLIKDYAEKGFMLGAKNHKLDEIRVGLFSTLKGVTDKF